MQSKDAPAPFLLNSSQLDSFNIAAEKHITNIYPVLFALILPVLIGSTAFAPGLYYTEIFLGFLILLPVVVFTKIVYDWVQKNIRDKETCGLPDYPSLLQCTAKC